MSAPAEIPGPWEHAYVAANGARFHVATCGEPTGRPVVLLHGFPQFWWAWRHQMPVLAAAGHRVVAMDLRGYGGSDKTPRGYDPFTLAGDVAGVVQALGLGRAALVGHGWGGYVAWAAAVLHREQVTSVATVSAPHPLWMLRHLRPGVKALGHVLSVQLPWVPERRLRDAGSGYLEGHLRAWAGPGSAFPSREELDDLPVGAGPVAVAALRAGVPPVAGPVAGPRRRPAVQPGDARAGRGAVVHDLRRRRSRAARPGPGPVAAVRRRGVPQQRAGGRRSLRTRGGAGPGR